MGGYLTGAYMGQVRALRNRPSEGPTATPPNPTLPQNAKNPGKPLKTSSCTTPPAIPEPPVDLDDLLFGPSTRSGIVHPLQTSFQRSFPGFIPPKIVHTYKAVIRRMSEISEKEPSLISTVERMHACFSDWHIFHFPKPNLFLVKPHRCYQKTCPICLNARKSILSARFLTMLNRMESPMLWTFTLKSNDMTLKECHQRITKAFAEFRKTPDFSKRVAGGFWSFEATWNHERHQWHPHLHVAMDTRYLNIDQARSTWHRITGDSNVIHFDRIRSNEHGARYVAKYTCKPPELLTIPPPQLVQYAVRMKSVRLWGSWGNCYRTPAPEMHFPEELGECLYVGRWNHPDKWQTYGNTIDHIRIMAESAIAVECQVLDRSYAEQGGP